MIPETLTQKQQQSFLGVYLSYGTFCDAVWIWFEKTIPEDEAVKVGRTDIPQRTHTEAVKSFILQSIIQILQAFRQKLSQKSLN